MSVIALIPAYNESERISATVRATWHVPGIDRVVVIDDASTDDTVAKAETSGAEVLALDRNMGKGAALDAGLAHVAEDADILLLLDGDLAETAAEAGVLLEPVLTGRADMTVATFPRPTGKAGFGLVKNLARWGIARMGAGFQAEAPLSGQRALSRSTWSRVTPFAFGYGVEVALTVRALRSGLRVLEVPTTMSHAATGRDLRGFLHRGRQFVHVLRAIVRLSLEPTDRRPSGDPG